MKFTNDEKRALKTTGIVVGLAMISGILKSDKKVETIVKQTMKPKPTKKEDIIDTSFKEPKKKKKKSLKKMGMTEYNKIAKNVKKVFQFD